MTGVALITGGSRGIGAATAKLAAKRGYAVCINFLKREDRAREVAEEIRAGGGRVLTIQGDTADEDDVLRLFAAVIASWGPSRHSSTMPASPAGPRGSRATMPPPYDASSTSM
jgi:NAD(P)-dependent dehydrogenase (short-subunit alcohol dehydrogenase family)